MPFSAPNIDHPEQWAGRTVGLLGGSFNPAHAGHKHISECALKLLGIDAVWWMVSVQNPLKSTSGMALMEDRLESAYAASQNDKIVVTDIERHLDTRYTADTLEKLKKAFPDTVFIWIMGRDNLNQIHKWDRWEDIFKAVPICVMDRPPQNSDAEIETPEAARIFEDAQIAEENAMDLKKGKAPAWALLHIPLHYLSATQIRENQKEKKS